MSDAPRVYTRPDPRFMRQLQSCIDEVQQLRDRAPLWLLVDVRGVETQLEWVRTMAEGREP